MFPDYQGGMVNYSNKMYITSCNEGVSFSSINKRIDTHKMVTLSNPTVVIMNKKIYKEYIELLKDYYGEKYIEEADKIEGIPIEVL